MLHLPHQLWGAVWGPGRRGGLSPLISLQLRQTAPAAPETSPRAKVWRGPGQLAPATAHTLHLHASPGDTKGCSATPPRAATPATPGAPRRSGPPGQPLAGGEPRRDDRPAPPGPARRARGYPPRRRRSSRASPSAAPARRAPGPGEQNPAPAPALLGTHRGPGRPRSLPSFLGKPSAGCAHPR